VFAARIRTAAVNACTPKNSGEWPPNVAAATWAMAVRCS
jgi:hypothetical protein